MYFKIILCSLLVYGSYSVANIKPSAKYPYSTNWRNTKNWKLYNIHTKNGFSYSIDTLRFFKNVPLNEDTMKAFLDSVSEIPLDKTPVWMGYYISSCQLNDGTTVKIVVSQYGGFFYAEHEKRYYQLPSFLRSNWLNFFTSKWRELDYSQH